MYSHYTKFLWPTHLPPQTSSRSFNHLSTGSLLYTQTDTQDT